LAGVVSFSVHEVSLADLLLLTLMVIILLHDAVFDTWIWANETFPAAKGCRPSARHLGRNFAVYFDQVVALRRASGSLNTGNFLLCRDRPRYQQSNNRLTGQAEMTAMAGYFFAISRCDEK
jgi:hypothetical protein